MQAFIDIETLPTDDPEVIGDILAEAEQKKNADIKAPSNYKDADKIAEYIKAKRAEIAAEADAEAENKIKRTSFDSAAGRIACICWAFDDGPVQSTLASDTEAQTLSRLFDSINTAAAVNYNGGAGQVSLVFVGHNLAAFDLPFIKHRSYRHNIRPPAQLLKAMNAKPWDACIADTMLMWSSDREKRISMDKLCRFFGIPGKGDFDGSMVASTWPTDPQKVIEYCRDDVERTRQIYKRLTFQLEAA